MSVQPGGWPEERRYDSRCRSLSPADKKALKRSRNPSVRLRPQEDLPVIQLHRKDVPSQQPDFDFLLSLPDKIPNQFMARVINDERARCTHSVVSTEELINLSLHAHLSRSLDLTLPEYLFLESWDCEAAETPVHQLRSDGYLPGALLHALARTCWRPDPSMDLDQMAEVFSLETLETQEDSPTTKEHLRAINGQKIGAMEQNHLVQELVAHLTRRGYPIAERNRAWQERFTLSVQSDLMTLGDTEEIASHLLQDSAEFDRSSLRRLQRDELSTLLQSFESLMEELGEESPQTWRRLIHKFRQQVPSPGRALSHIRVVMTGQPRGPSLASVLWLLGIEECRARISKARSLHC
jgi:glutamyl/glutaminyl-tRNA synthetase